MRVWANILQHKVPRIEAKHRDHHRKEQHIAHNDRDGEPVEMEVATHAASDEGRHGDNP